MRRPRLPTAQYTFQESAEFRGIFRQFLSATADFIELEVHRKGASRLQGSKSLAIRSNFTVQVTVAEQDATVFQTAADAEIESQCEQFFFLRDICCDIATGKNLHFSRSNTTPVRLLTEGLVFINKRYRSEHFRRYFVMGEIRGTP
jgi:hypothetical protein